MTKHSTAQTDLEVIMLSKPDFLLSEKAKHIAYRWNLKKMIEMNLFTKQIDSQT